MKKNNKTKKTGEKSLSRRKFVGQVGVATAAFTIIPRNVLGGQGFQSPSDMINVAGIGIGARGAADVRGVADPDVPIVSPARSSTGIPYTAEQLAAQAAQQAARAAQQATAAPAAAQPAQAAAAPRKLANIYALCDVDTDFAAHIFKGYPKAKVYTDWREMLDKDKSIDAVVIGTPDHNHAGIAAAAMRLKKHVYCEKPLCKTVVEARTLAKLAKEFDVVTQTGNQGHATEGTRQTVEWIQSGLIGNVRKVMLSTNRPSWPQGNLPRPPAMPVPKSLNYDIWLGPAPEKPYNPNLLHFNWRGLWDYGTGAMGDMGAHIFDAPVWSLNLGMPTKIQATSSPYSTDYLPQSSWVTYEFAARGTMPAVTVTWCDGGLRPPRPAELEAGRTLADASYYGDKGIIMHASHGAIPQLVPANNDFKGIDPWLPRTGDIYQDWIGAILAGKKSCNDFSYSTKVTEIMLLTNIALLTKSSNTTLEYDAVNMKITNLPEANKYFHYEYRSGWTL
jgi:predicted dehydrogenase